MSILGNFIAKVLIDTSGVGSSLTDAEKRFKTYTKTLEEQQNRLDNALVMSLEYVTKKRAESVEEAKTIYKSLSVEQQKLVDKTQSGFVKSLDERARAQTALAQKQIAEIQKVERENASANAKQLASEKKLRDEEQRLIIRNNQIQEKAFQEQLLQQQKFRTQVASWASLAITIPIYFGTRAALDDFVAFQQELANVQAVTGSTASEIQELSDLALDMASNFRFSATEIAEAFLELGQAGYNANQIMAATKDVMVLAAAGMKDIEFTSTLVVTTLEAFNLEATEAGRVADVFAASNAKSVSSLDKISASLKYTAGLWASQNWDIENLIGILGVLYDTGVRGEKAGRLLASAINGLSKPTAAATKEIVKLFGAADALSPALYSVEEIIEKLATANDGMGVNAENVFSIFGKESAEVINRLVNNFDQIEGSIAGVTNQVGTAAEQAAIQARALGSEMTRTKNEITGISKTIINFLEPAITNLIQGIRGMAEAFSQLPASMQAFLGLGVVVAGLSAPIGVLIPKLASAVKGLVAFRTAILGVQATALGTGLLFGGIGIAVTGIATAFASAAKAQRDWEDAVLDGSSKLAKSGEDIDDLVDSVRKLYATGDTQNLSKELEKLSEVFPGLRKELNKNASGTAEAMSSLNKEYAEFLRLKSDIALGSTELISGIPETSLSQTESQLADYNAQLEELFEHAKRFNGIGLEQLGYILSSQGYDGVIVKGAVKDFDKLYEVFGEMSQQDVSDYFEKLGTGIGSANSQAQNFVNSYVEILAQIESLETEAQKLRDYLNLQEDIDKSVEAFDGLEQLLNSIFDSLSTSPNVVIADAIQDDADRTKAVLSAFTSVAKQGVSDIFSEFPAALESLGVTEEGLLSKPFTDLLARETDAIIRATNLAAKEQNISFEEAFSKYAYDVTYGMKSLPIAFEEIEKAVQEGTFNISNMGEESEQVWSAIATLLAVANVETQKLGGSSSATLDWWQQLKQEIQDFSDILLGINVTSLNQKLEELGEKGSVAYNEIEELGKKLQEAFSQNPKLASLVDDYDIVSELIKQVTVDLENQSIAMLKSAGVNTTAAEQLQRYAKLQEESSDLLKNREIYSITEEKDLWIANEQAIIENNKALEEMRYELGLIPEVASRVTQTVQELNDEFQNRQQIDNWHKAVKDGAISISELVTFQKELSEAENDGILETIKNINMQVRANEENKKLQNEVKKELEEQQARQQQINELIARRSQLTSFDTTGEDDLTQNIQSELAEIESKAVELGIDLDFPYDELDKIEKSIHSLNAEEISLAFSEADSIKDISNLTSDVASVVEKMALSFINAGMAIKDWANNGESFDNVTASIIGISEGLSNVGGTVGAVAGAIAETTKAVVTIVNGIQNIFNTVDLDEALMSAEIASQVQQAVVDAENQIRDELLDFGDTIGSTLIDGIKEGLSDNELDDVIREEVINVLMQEVVALSGLKETIADLTEDMWNGLTPGGTDIKGLEAEIASLESSISNINPDVLNARIKDLEKSASNAKGDTKDDLEEQISDYKEQLEFYNEVQSEIEARKKAIADIEAASGGISIGNLDKEAIEKLKEDVIYETEEVRKVLDELWNTLGDDADEKAQEFSDSLARSLAEAVLTGSYSDFRSAVYNAIVSQVIDALIEAEVVQKEIEQLVKNITELDPTDELGRESIRQQINNISSSLAGYYTDLQDLFSPIRDGLADFGGLDVNVNPGSVVTALPSDVENKLVGAITDVTKNLSQAITQAGLNSHIDVVNITTAHISSMIATSVAIQNAQFDMNGNIAIGSIEGSDLGDFIRDTLNTAIGDVKP